MADSAVSALTASDALAGTELFYADGLASAAAADVKVTATQIKTFATAAPITMASDLILGRRAAGSLEMRNGANAQELTLYRTYTDASNYERAILGFITSGNEFLISTEKAGSGTGRSLWLKAAGNFELDFGSSSEIRFQENGSILWRMVSGGELKPETDNSTDIGDASHRVRDLYVGRDLYTAGGTQAIMRSSTAITSGAGAQAGTLSNAPAAGNPTKWIPFNDFGTTRYIPAW